MPERSSYEPGVPCWVDYGVADIDASTDFYGKLFGWEVPERPDSAEMGGYRRAQKDGADVAGIYPQMQEGMPHVWVTYIATADAEATAAKVTAAGGQVIAPPMKVMDFGSLAVFLDPTGAAFGVWEADGFAGAEKVNEPGTFAWNELGTRDTDAARAFYTEVFGWSYREQKMERNEGEPAMGPEVYIEILLNEGDEESIGGMMDITGMLPDEVPAHWLTYFSVADADAAIATVEQSGGGVNFGPVDIPAGRFAVVREPGEGAVFAVIQLPS